MHRMHIYTQNEKYQKKKEDKSPTNWSNIDHQTLCTFKQIMLDSHTLNIFLKKDDKLKEETDNLSFNTLNPHSQLLLHINTFVHP